MNISIAFQLQPLEASPFA